MQQGDLDRATELIRKSTEGWGGLDPKLNAEKKHQQAMVGYEVAQRIAGCFSGTAGQAALQDLRTRFVDPQTWPVIATGQGDTLAHGCTREGQKTVIKYIENCIKIAQSPAPTVDQFMEQPL